MTTPGPEGPWDEQPPPNPYGQSYQPYPPQQYQPYPQQPYLPQGYPQQAYQPLPYGHAQSNDGMGIAAMVVGIVAMAGATFTCGLTLLASPVALVLGLVSMRRVARSHGQLGGRGMAIAGFVLGIVGTVLLVLGIAFIVLAGTTGAFVDDPGTSTY